MWTPADSPRWLEFDGIEPAAGVRIASMPIRRTMAETEVPQIGAVPLVDSIEAARFATAKRAEEHAAGRWLLNWMLGRSRIVHQLSSVEIVRDENRAPKLVWISGCFRSEALPAFSISTSNQLAIVAICDQAYDVGIDIEPLGELRSSNLLPMMSTGDEFGMLVSAGIELVNRTWTAKEAVLKCMRKGMSLALPSIVVLDDSGSVKPLVECKGTEVSLMSFESDGYSISLALRESSEVEYVPTDIEIELLKRIRSGDVGCPS